MSACSSQLGCVDVSWVPGSKGACYLKNALVAQVTNSAVWGARLVANSTVMAPITNDFGACAASFISGSSGCGTPIPSFLTPGNAGSLSDSNVITLTLRDGSTRKYYMYLPPNYKTNTPAPVIISYHGNGETGINQALRTGFQDTTMNLNTITVYPSGVGGSWQGAPYSTPGIDDVSFTRQLFTYLSKNFCIDPTRVYATGCKSHINRLLTLTPSNIMTLFYSFKRRWFLQHPRLRSHSFSNVRSHWRKLRCQLPKQHLRLNMQSFCSHLPLQFLPQARPLSRDPWRHGRHHPLYRWQHSWSMRGQHPEVDE